MTIFIQMWSLFQNILLWSCYLFFLPLELLMKTLLYKTDTLEKSTPWIGPFFCPLIWLSVRWASFCLVPVWHLSRPSRSMHFGDISETNGWTSWRETHRPRKIMKPLGTRHLFKKDTYVGLDSDFLKSLRKALMSNCSCKWPQSLLRLPNWTFPLFISSHKQPLRVLLVFINTLMKLHTKLMVRW